MKKAQTVTSISLGMGSVGQERLSQYKKLAKERGYESLSALIIDLVDSDLGISLPKPKRRQTHRKSK